MKKINIVRLNTTIMKSEKCLDELDQFFNELISERYEDAPIIKRSMELSFRSLFTSFQSLVEDYVSIVLRTLSIDVSRLYFRQSLDMCVENKFLSSKFVEGFKLSIKLRNDIAHGYDVPTTEVLVNYYKDNKDIYRQFIKDITEFKLTLKNEELF
ncbi:MAG: hypothetical protein ACRDAU_05455 [Clostridium sp.]